MQRTPLAVAACALFIGSCTGTDTAPTSSTTAPTTTAGSVATTTTAPPATTAPSTTRATTTTTTEAPLPAGLVASLPAGPCDGIGATPAAATAEITFVVDGRVYATDPTGTAVRCVGAAGDPGSIEWGPAGDRLLLDGDRIVGAETFSGGVAAAAHWSRPTGSSLIWVEDGRLTKARLDATAPRDITFLARHDEVAYHPAGTNLATIGESSDGRYGIWWSTNEGDDPQLLVEVPASATPPPTLSGIVFSHEGLDLFFVADAGDEYHLYDVFLVGELDTPPIELAGDYPSIFSSSIPLGDVAVSAWDFGWAIGEGGCGSGDGFRTRLVDFLELPAEVRDLDSVPVGWVPGDMLAILTFPDGCQGRADLWLVGFGRQFEEPPQPPTAELVYAGVDGAAIRAPLPDPPPPLGDVALDQFA